METSILVGQHVPFRPYQKVLMFLISNVFFSFQNLFCILNSKVQKSEWNILILL